MVLCHYSRDRAVNHSSIPAAPRLGADTPVCRLPGWGTHCWPIGYSPFCYPGSSRDIFCPGDGYPLRGYAVDSLYPALWDHRRGPGLWLAVGSPVRHPADCGIFDSGPTERRRGIYGDNVSLRSRAINAVV